MSGKTTLADLLRLRVVPDPDEELTDLLAELVDNNALVPATLTDLLDVLRADVGEPDYEAAANKLHSLFKRDVANVTEDDWLLLAHSIVDAAIGGRHLVSTVV